MSYDIYEFWNRNYEFSFAGVAQWLTRETLKDKLFAGETYTPQSFREWEQELLDTVTPDFMRAGRLDDLMENELENTGLLDILWSIYFGIAEERILELNDLVNNPSKIAAYLVKREIEFVFDEILYELYEALSGHEDSFDATDTLRNIAMDMVDK